VTGSYAILFRAVFAFSTRSFAPGWEKSKKRVAYRGRKLKTGPNKTPMKITEILMAEHAVFHNLFDHIESVAPRLKTLAEVKTLATVVQRLHEPHSRTEDDLFLQPLEHCFEQLGQNENFHAEHEQIEAMLTRVYKARTLQEAKKTLLGAMTACRRHFDKEERIVFPMAERVLKARTLSEMGQAWLKQRDARLHP
jgi:hemerythrin-like domain-containing protein